MTYVLFLLWSKTLTFLVTAAAGTDTAMVVRVAARPTIGIIFGRRQYFYAKAAAAEHYDNDAGGDAEDKAKGNVTVTGVVRAKLHPRPPR